MAKIHKTDEQWREQLTEEQYAVTRQQATEKPFSGEHDQRFDQGDYHCICCGAKLFHSDEKFNASCGWPSFSKPASDDVLVEHADDSLADRPRTEVVCQQCDAHLGHVFSDGPKQAGGLRYCINSVALRFVKKG